MTELKRVKIDDHIKSTVGSSSEPIKRKRGRPRKNPIPPSNAQQVGAGNNAFNSVPGDSQMQTGANPASGSAQAVPVYDTTEEAKAFIRAPFDIMAGITGVQDLALYPHQLEALAPSFKVVYDKRIAPYMGANADIYAFAIVLSGIAFEKVLIFKQHQDRAKPKAPNKTTDETGHPVIPHEVI